MKKLPFKQLRHALTTPFFKFIILLTACSPRFLNKFNAIIIGHVLAWLPLPSNKIIQNNQKKILNGSKFKLSSSTIYTNILNGYFDFFYLSYRSDKKFNKIVHFEGIENLTDALALNRGIIAITAHFGAWELLPRAIKLMGFNIAVIGRSLQQESASNILEKLRQKPRIVTIDRNAGASPIIRILKKNYIVGMLIDQDTKGVNSRPIDFLGMPALTPVAPAILSKKRNIPIVSMHLVKNKKSKYLLKIDKPIIPQETDTITEILTLLNKRISSWIEKEPESWVWFHKRWKRKAK